MEFRDNIFNTSAPPSHINSNNDDATRSASGEVAANGMSDSETAAVATADATHNSLWSLPELAERYVPMYSSLEEVTYRDPMRFSLKPPCWEAWTADEYRKTADYLQRIKLHPLARDLGKPVEEVYHVLQALVSEPLYDMGKASRRGIRGIRSLFALYNEYGAPMRPWTKEGVVGELDGVNGSRLELILEDGSKGSVHKEDLTEEDQAWLEDHGFPAHEAAPMDLRLWTDEFLMASFVNVSYKTVNIATKEGRTHEVKEAQLNDGDKLWMKRHVGRALLCEFLGLQPRQCDERMPEEARKYLGTQPLEENSAAAEGELSKFRVWTKSSVVAKLEDVSNGTLRLKRGDGTRLNVPVLTEIDRKVFNDQLSTEMKEKIRAQDKLRSTHTRGIKAPAENTDTPQALAVTDTVHSESGPTGPMVVSSRATADAVPSRSMTLEAPAGNLVRLHYDPSRIDLSSAGKRKRNAEHSASLEAEGRRLMASVNLQEALENGSRMITPRKSMTPAMQETTTPKAPRAILAQPAPLESQNNFSERKVSTTSKKNVLRGWGASGIDGQLVAVSRSNVRVRTSDGTEKLLGVKTLTEEDVKWLRNTLKGEKLEILFE